MKGFYLACTVVFALIMGACTNDDNVFDEDNVLEQETKQITMTASDFKYADGSRTLINFGPEGGGFTWAADDTVGIFPGNGSQVAFPMTKGVGTKIASFTGGGWALKPSSTYAAYYPLQGMFYLDKKSIPVGYEGQIQHGDASTAHLGKCDFMAAKATTPNEGNVSFAFKHLGCIVQLKLSFPKATSVPGVRLSASGSPFVTRGTVDITADVPSVRAVSTSSFISLNLDHVSSPADAKPVTVCFMMAPTDLSGKDIEVSAAGYKSTISGKHFVAGYAYVLSVNFKQSDHPELPSTVEWVDLGLPSGVKWASHNVGATKPEEYGDYFAWGEDAPKKVYDLYNSLTHGKPWNDIAGDVRYDAATANWGEPARMPTKAEIQELIQNTTFEWSPLNEIKGLWVTSKINKRKIFFPAAGLRTDKELQFPRMYGKYWSSSPNPNDDGYAYFLDLGSYFFDCMLRGGREYGFSVRPVCD